MRCFSQLYYIDYLFSICAPGSHCILLENIDIYFSSQLELNTILPGLKRNKTQTKTLRKCPQPYAYLPLPSALGWVSNYAPPLPSLPRRLGARGWMTRDSQSWAGPRKSHLIHLGVGGRGQMKRTETGKKIQTIELPTLTYLSHKVRSKVTDHALRWGVWGQAGGRGERWAQRQHRCEGASKSPWRRGRLARKQSHQGPGSRQQAD